MAKQMPNQQDYPRSGGGLLNIDEIDQPCKKLSSEQIEKAIRKAIADADKKSVREMLSLPENADDKAISKVYKKAAKKLFDLFKKYSADPAVAPARFAHKDAKSVANDIYLAKRTKDARMNAGWRYQFLAVELAQLQKGRFKTVSGGGEKTDLIAEIPLKGGKPPVTIYVSVKNRKNTISGGSREGVIRILENLAKNAKNDTGFYLCVFGITMESGKRSMMPHSRNTEQWPANFFWEFFSGLSHKEVMSAVGKILEEEKASNDLGSDAIPDKVLDEFVQLCKKKNLIDENDKFKDAEHLVDFFL